MKPIALTIALLFTASNSFACVAHEKAAKLKKEREAREAAKKEAAKAPTTKASN